MNRETILQIAKECGFGDYKFNDNYTTCKKSDLERFAHRMMAEGVKMAAGKAGREFSFDDSWMSIWLNELAEQLEKGE